MIEKQVCAANAMIIEIGHKGRHKRASVARNALRLLVPLFAFVFFFAQMAVFSCPAGNSDPAQLQPLQTAFPICHSARASDSSRDHGDGHGPDDQATCPFCALHCGAAAALMSGTSWIAGPLSWVSAPSVPTPVAIMAAARYAGNALPRGPPFAV